LIIKHCGCENKNPVNIDKHAMRHLQRLGLHCSVTGLHRGSEKRCSGLVKSGVATHLFCRCSEDVDNMTSVKSNRNHARISTNARVSGKVLGWQYTTQLLQVCSTIPWRLESLEHGGASKLFSSPWFGQCRNQRSYYSHATGNNPKSNKSIPGDGLYSRVS